MVSQAVVGRKPATRHVWVPSSVSGFQTSNLRAHVWSLLVTMGLRVSVDRQRAARRL